MPISVSERRFVWLSVIVAMIAAVVLAEFSLGVMEKYQKRTTPDFGDVKRLRKMGWGGFLKENFSAQVTDGYGGKVQWTNNAEDFAVIASSLQNPSRECSASCPWGIPSPRATGWGSMRLFPIYRNR